MMVETGIFEPFDRFAPADILTLVIGNDSRGDDGLGWAFGKALEVNGWPGPIEYRYQLQVEDAELVANARAVLFVDAWQGGEEPFRLEICQPQSQLAYTTHRQDPTAILHLCQEIFGHHPPAWMLMISGEEWDLGSGLSKKGQANLNLATKVVVELTKARG